MMLLTVEMMVYFSLGATVLSLVRVVWGPSSSDRLIGLNLVSAQILTMLILIAVEEQMPIYLDVALVYDIFGFVGLLTITKYFGNKEQNP